VPFLPNLGGWVEGASSSVNTAITYLFNYLNVPSAPSDTSTNPIIFLWNGIEPNNGAWIVQPVLAYGCDGYFLLGVCQGIGGAYWWISAFYVVSGTATYTPPIIKVNTGDQIALELSYQSSCNGSGNAGYYIFVDDNGNGKSNNECYITSSAQPDGYLMLEAYNVASCAQLPNQDGAQFYTIQWTPSSVSWGTDLIGGSPSCSYATYTGPTAIHVHSYPTTDTLTRSHGMSINAPLPNPWWYPYYPSSQYTIATTGSSFDYYYTDSSNVFHLGITSYVYEAASGFCPSYCWHSQIYVNSALNNQSDVDRSHPVKATFTVNSWTVYWVP